MQKSFGGEFPTNSSVQSNNEPTWMGWFNEPHHADNGKQQSIDVAKQSQRGQGDLTEQTLGNAAHDQKTANMMREVHQAQLRLREQRRGLGDEGAPIKTLPAVAFTDDASNRVERTAARTQEAITTAEIQKPVAKAAENFDGVSSAYKQLSDIRNGNSASGDWLKKNGLFQQFDSDQTHAHLSFSPDGTVNMALKTADPNAWHRWTIVCRPDGSSSERITSHAGQELARFSNNRLMAGSRDKSLTA